MGEDAGSDTKQTVAEGARRRRARESRSGEVVGRYVLRDKLGAGAMGAVYLAFDPDLDRNVVVKLVHRDAGDTMARSRRARMVREAQAQAKLAHTNVVRVLDVGTTDDGVFIAMEFIDGVSLRDWMAGGGRPYSGVLDVFEAAGRGLAAAHDAGLVHRDFKPDNVMVGRDGRVCVTDFGLARGAGQDAEGRAIDHNTMISASLTRTGTIVGTPRYMAPEQFAAESVDHRSDQFSFCVALWEALYDQLPFEGESVRELAVNVRGGHITSPPRETAVPERVHAALLRGLSVAPEDRFANMDALLAELRHQPARRWRWVAVGCAGVLAVAGITAGVTWALVGSNEAADEARAQIVVDAGPAPATSTRNSAVATPPPLIDAAPAVVRPGARQRQASRAKLPATASLSWCYKNRELVCSDDYKRTEAEPGHDCQVISGKLRELEALPRSRWSSLNRLCRQGRPQILAMMRNRTTRSPPKNGAPIVWCERLWTFYCAPAVVKHIPSNCGLGKTQRRTLATLPSRARVSHDATCKRTFVRFRTYVRRLELLASLPGHGKGFWGTRARSVWREVRKQRPRPARGQDSTPRAGAAPNCAALFNLYCDAAFTATELKPGATCKGLRYRLAGLQKPRAAAQRDADDAACKASMAEARRAVQRRVRLFAAIQARIR